MPDMNLDSPDFSITTTALSDETAKSWLFGNPLRDTLNASMAAITEANSGLLVQNANWQKASAGAGILRTMNKVLEDAKLAAKANATYLAWGAAIFGVLLVAKAVKPASGRRR